MANYIQTLEANQRELARQIKTAKLELDSFINFLHSDKFKGTDSHNERKDWIATGDVLNWIRETKGILEGVDTKEFHE